MARPPSICDGFWDKVTISDVKDAGSFTVKLCGSEVSVVNMRSGINAVSLRN